MDDLGKRVSELTEAVARCELMLRKLTDRPDSGDGRKGRAKYPWALLESDGEFFWDCLPTVRDRTQASISAGAIQRYGKGAVSVRKTKGGIRVRRKNLSPET